MNTAPLRSFRPGHRSYLQLSCATQEQPTWRPKYPYGFVARGTCINHTNQGLPCCNLDTSFEGVSNRKLSRMRVVTGSGREGALESEGSLAERELSFLVRLAQAAASTQKPDELLELIIGEATSAMGTDVCSLYLVTPRGRELLLTATNGLNQKMVGKATMRVGEGITGWVAETRRPAVVPDVSEEPHWKWVPGLDEDRFRSMLSVPIESGPRLVGVLNVQTVEKRAFDSGDIDFLRAIAGQVAGILERSELQRRMEVQIGEIQLSHDIHERFTKLSLEGAGIQAILEVAGTLAGGHAVLYSPDGYRVRGMGEASDGMPPRIHVPVPLAQAGAREVRINAGRPSRPLDVVPVRAGADLLGLLAVAVDEQTVDSHGRRRAPRSPGCGAERRHPIPAPGRAHAGPLGVGGLPDPGRDRHGPAHSREAGGPPPGRGRPGDEAGHRLGGYRERGELGRRAGSIPCGGAPGAAADPAGRRERTHRLLPFAGRLPPPARGAEPRRVAPFRRRAARHAAEVRAVA